MSTVKHRPSDIFLSVHTAIQPPTLPFFCPAINGVRMHARTHARIGIYSALAAVGSAETLFYVCSSHAWLRMPGCTRFSYYKHDVCITAISGCSPQQALRDLLAVHVHRSHRHVPAPAPPPPSLARATQILHRMCRGTRPCLAETVWRSQTPPLPILTPDADPNPETTYLNQPTL
jgi:hypothetical protein